MLLESRLPKMIATVLRLRQIKMLPLTAVIAMIEEQDWEVKVVVEENIKVTPMCLVKVVQKASHSEGGRVQMPMRRCRKVGFQRKPKGEEHHNGQCVKRFAKLEE